MSNVNFSTLAQAVQAALAGGNTSLASSLLGLFHQTPSNTGLSIKDKTMTTTWVSANPTQAATLEALGYTIVLG
jgi:DNA-binding NarL/FixJ family response regulator